MIKIEHVSKVFRGKKEVAAVKDCNLEIKDGEIFGIVGYSGAGKSTLVRLLNQLETVDEGSIWVNDVDITKLKGEGLRQARQKIAMIFQHFNLLWSRTVLENIAFPLEIKKMPKAECLKIAKEMAEKVGLGDKILLCDEATSALDPKTTDDILELLKQINRESGITIVMITHQMETVQKICHRLAVMADGKVVECDTVENIFANPTHQLTKQLIQTVDTGMDVKKMSVDLKEKYPEGHLLRIAFEKENSEKPVLFNIATRLNIPINIVGANIKNTQAGPLGVMYIHIEARRDILPLVEALVEQGVKVEVI